MLMQLDVNTEIYPIKKEDKYALLITPTLHADGTGDSGYYGQVIISLSLFLSSSCRNNPSAKQMSLVAGHRRSIYTQGLHIYCIYIYQEKSNKFKFNVIILN